MSKVAVGWRWGGFVYNDGNEVWRDEATNSAGGICVRIEADITETEKQVKYVDFEMVPKNRVGDPVASDTSGEYTFTAQVIGPLSADRKGIIHARFFQTTDEPVFYSKVVSSVALRKVKITFMDGTVEEIAGKDCGDKKVGGCYVATCVYGSYDCPQVWTLRRYRDNQLSKTWYGRVFIHTYYAISPTLVKWFGDTDWFKNMWKPKLDKMIENLQAEGVENTPYNDKMW